MYWMQFLETFFLRRKLFFSLIFLLSSSMSQEVYQSINFEKKMLNKRFLLPFSFFLISIFLISTCFSYTECASGKFRTWKFENCSFDNVDGCARIVMLYGARDLVLPDNEKDMKPHCE